MLGLLLLLAMPALQAAETVKIGVLAYRAKPQTLAQWRPLAAALKLAVPERDFEIEAYTYPELNMAVASRQLDFVLTNPGHYVLLSKRNALSSPLATLAVEDGGQTISVQGGVIFSRDNTGIALLSDLKGRTIACADRDSLDGFQMQAYELRRNGIVLPQDARLLNTGMRQDDAVAAALDGRADAGFVRSGLLEAMAREGRLDMSRIRILNPQHLAGFPERVSTRLYPEWPFAAPPHIDENLARRVAAALFVLEKNTAATRAIGIHGFVIPADYTPVSDMLRELRLPPFDSVPEFTLRDVWTQYRGQLSGFLVAGGLVLLLLLRLLWINRRLDAEHRQVLLQKQQLEESELRYRTVANFTADWEYWVMPDGKFRYISPSCEQVSGYRADEFYADPELITRIVHPDDLPLFSGHIHRLSAQGVPEPIYFRIYTKDGRCRWISHACRAVYDADGAALGFRASNRDSTEQKQMEERVHRLAFYDPLTELPNRRLLDDRLSQAMAASKRSGLYGAVMFLDLDNFKPLNDRHGHGVGDLLLIEVATRLKGCVRDMDTVARFGGDEFVVMLSELDRDRQQSEVQAGIVAEKIRASLSEPYHLTVAEVGKEAVPVEHSCSATIGVVLFNNHEFGQDDIIRQADCAMYQAKEAGRNLVRFFDGTQMSSASLKPIA